MACQQRHARLVSAHPSGSTHPEQVGGQGGVVALGEDHDMRRARAGGADATRVEQRDGHPVSADRDIWQSCLKPLGSLAHRRQARHDDEVRLASQADG